MKVGVTGASGYVGSKLCEFMEGNGVELYELGRTEPDDTDRKFLEFSLRDGIAVDALSDLDCVVHLAYDFEPVSWDEITRINVEGTLDLFETAETAGTHVVQISSLSAFEGCKSNYGKAKLLTEREAFDRDFHVIRPGLVFGRDLGSILDSLHTVAKSAPLIPIPTDRPHVHYQCHYGDLGELVYECCSGNVGNTSDPIVAAASESRTFREILEILATYEGNSARFVPVPKSSVYYGLRVLETLGIDIGLRSDSVVGLVNSNANPDFSATRATGVSFREFMTETLQQDI